VVRCGKNGNGMVYENYNIISHDCKLLIQVPVALDSNCLLVSADRATCATIVQRYATGTKQHHASIGQRQHLKCTLTQCNTVHTTEQNYTTVAQQLHNIAATTQHYKNYATLCNRCTTALQQVGQKNLLWYKDISLCIANK